MNYSLNKIILRLLTATSIISLIALTCEATQKPPTKTQARVSQRVNAVVLQEVVKIVKAVVQKNLLSALKRKKPA